MPGYELIGNEEFQSVKSVFDNGGILFRHGFETMRNNKYFVKEFETAFAHKLNSKYALAVSSGTAALRVALASLDIGENDEVITQSFTFVATVEAIIESRATPICCEVDDTLNMDPEDLKNKITPRTKAIIVVHMLGNPARLNAILKVAKDHNLYVIEDTAWGCGGSQNGIKLGTFGDIGTFSFDFAKTITCGEGGMLVFKDEVLASKAAAWHDHGHENNPKFPRWEDTRSSSGFNYRMTELQGAVGLAQLSKLDAIITSQRQNYKKIESEISKLPLKIRTSVDGSEGTADALIFYVKDRNEAKRCRESLINNGFGTKILPEAYSWHFAGSWDHMPELKVAHGNNLNTAFPNSANLLAKSVSIPINVKMKSDTPEKIRLALESVFTTPENCHR